MENKQQSNSTSRRQLLPPLYPTSANAGRRSYHHRSSSLPPFPYNNPAATHFNSQTYPYGSGSTASSSSYHYHQMLPLPLSQAHPSGSSAGSSTLHARSFSQTSMFGSGWDASGSSYQRLPSPPSQAHVLGGGADGMGGNSTLLQSEGAFSGSSYYQMAPPSPLAMDPTSPSIGGVDGSGGGSISCNPTFVSSSETILPLSDSSDGHTSLSSSGLPPLLTQSPASVDGMAHEYVLPPLPSTLPPSSLQTTTVDLEDELPLPPCGPPPSETTMDLEDIIGAAPECISLVDDDNASHIVSRHNMDPDSLGYVNSSGDMGNNDSSSSSRVHCPPPTPFTLPSPAYAMMKNEPLDWSFLVGRHAGSSSSSMQNEPIVFERKPVLPLLPSPELGAESSSRSGETSRGKKVAAGTLVKDFADGLFTQDEITEIMGEKALAEMVLINPKGVRRIIRNRAYSRIAKQRKTEYLSGLERKAELLEQQTKLLSAGLQSMQSTAHRLATENNAMKIRLHGLVQQQKLMIDLNETLQAEVQRLKLDAGVISGSQVSNGLYQQTSPQVMQQEQLQTYNQLTQLQQSQQQQGAHDNFTTDLQGSFI